MSLTACGTVSAGSSKRPPSADTGPESAAGAGFATSADSAAPAHPVRSQWPSDADYNTIATAVRVRDHALRLKPWNQKAYAAELGMRTLLTLEHKLRPGNCATFVAHVYSELMDLSQAYAGEDWRPMFVVVAHDSGVASQCRSPALPVNDDVKGVSEA